MATNQHLAVRAPLARRRGRRLEEERRRLGLSGVKYIRLEWYGESMWNADQVITA